MEKPIRKGIPMKKCNCQICLNILLMMGLFLFPVGAGALEPISEETDALLRLCLRGDGKVKLVVGHAWTIS